MNNLGSPDKIKKDIDDIVKSLKDAKTEVTTIASDVAKMGSAFNSVKTPKELQKTLDGISNSQELLTQKTKEYESLQKKLISSTAKLALVNSDENKSLNLLNKEKQILNKTQKNELIQISKLSTEYEKLSAQTNNLRREQKGLLVLKEKDVKLTTEQAKRLSFLNEEVKKNDTILKKVDASSGQFFRNIGNYSSGFDGLSNSINNLTREAPAFAVSMQTGFLALSNNIPIFFDQIKLLIAKNQELKAGGKETVSVLKQLGRSFFSIGTLISTSVTLLTLYGDKLFKLIDIAIKGKAPIRKLAEEQKIYNDALKEGAKSASLEVSQMKLLFSFAKDTSKSYNDRNKAVNKLIKSSRGLITEQDRLNILNGKALDIENKLTKAILQKAIVSELTKKLAEDVNKLLDKEIELQKIKEKRSKTVTIEELKNLKSQGKVLEGTTINKRKALALDQKAGEITKEKTRLESNFNKILERTSKLLNLNTLDLNSNTKSVNERNKATSISLKTTEEQAESYKKLSVNFKKVFAGFGDNLVNLAKKDLNVFDARTVQRYLDALKNKESFKSFGDGIVDVSARLDDFNKKVSDDLIKVLDNEALRGSFSDLSKTIEQFTGISGQKFVNLFDAFKDNSSDSFQKIADIGKQTAGIIGDAFSSMYDKRIEELDLQIEKSNEFYDNEIEKAEGDKQTQDELRRDKKRAEKKLKKEQDKERRKKFEAEKAFALADIAINTASAVVKALPNIPLSVAVGSLGLIQAGIVASTPIPAFAEGGTMDHDGLMLINDHSSGRLELVEREGQFYMSTQKNAYVQGKKGDKIHKDAKETLRKNPEIMGNISNLNAYNSQKAILEGFKSSTRNTATTQDINRLISAVKGKRTKFNVNNNFDLGSELSYLSRGDF